MFDLQSAITSLAKAAPAKPKVKSIPLLKEQLKHYCDIFTEGPICLGDGSRIISKALNMDGIIGDFNFNQKINVDQSGLSNMVSGNFDVRPGKGGLGSAAFFKKNDFLTMDHLELYNSKEITVVIWVYIRKLKKAEHLCPIFLKGNEDPKYDKFVRAPAIFINQHTGTVTTAFSKKEKATGVQARTLGYLKPGKWNQIAAIFTEKTMKIYLNGVLDGFSLSEEGGEFARNSDPIYIGGHPNYLKECKIEMTIDSLKMYNRELKNYEIQAGVKDPMGIIEPSYFHLGCFDCTYSEAKNKCVKNYKLCSAEELYSGVWQAAHIMGWTDLEYYIWTDDSEQTGVKGMGICCRAED